MSFFFFVLLQFIPFPLFLLFFFVINIRNRSAEARMPKSPDHIDPDNSNEERQLEANNLSSSSRAAFLRNSSTFTTSLQDSIISLQSVISDSSAQSDPFMLFGLTTVPTAPTIPNSIMPHTLVTLQEPHPEKSM